jgi:sugar/nucleoside kinase (ribokinase family)
MDEFDVYAYGVISSSTLHLLSLPFPAADAYAEIAQSYAMTGGEALNSAVVLSRLGLRVRLDGNWIGGTPDGRQLLKRVRSYQIDARRLKVKKDYVGVREIVFSDEKSRTIFGNYIDLLSSTRKWNIPVKEDLASARVVCVDPPFGAESALVGRWAAELGKPYVTIDCPYDQDLASSADVLIISGEFRERTTPGANLTELFSVYQQRARGLVIFTVGGDEILYGRAGGAVTCCQPYPVKVIDSAGAGDSFRAGVIYGMLRGWNDAEMIQYAAALAGMVCTRFPGVLNSPTHAEVMQFIQARGAAGG